jgi:putative ABC transport system permease protein
MTRLSLKSMAARPLRTALTTLAIVLGVALVVGSLTLTDTQRKAADSLSAASYDGTDAVVSAKTAFNIDLSDDWSAQKPTIAQAMIEKVRSVPEVGVAVGDVTDFNAKYIDRQGKPIGDGPWFGVGYDARTPGADRTAPFRLSEGRWATGPGQVVIDEKTSEDEGYGLGDRVRINGAAKTESYEVVGVARFGSVKSLGTATFAVLDLETAQKAFGKRDGVDSILVAGREGTTPGQVRAALSRELGSSATVQTAAEHDRFTFDGLEMFISIIRTVLLVFGGVAILVGALTIVNSLSITLVQRTQEIGLLRLIGAGRGQVLTAVALEALVIGLVGSVVGLGVGYLIALGLQGLFVSMGLDLPDAGTVFSAGTVVAGLLVGTIVTVLAGVVPAVRATRIAPVAAMRDADPAAAQRKLLGRVISPVVGLIGRPAERVGGVAGVLARRNAMRNPTRTLATAAALTVGVALVTLVAVMAAGLKDTMEGSLDRRVAATHVVTAEDDWSPTTPEVASTLRSADGVEGVTTIRQDVGSAFGDNERVNAVDGTHVKFDYAAGSAAADRLGRDGAIVDESWAKEHGLSVGERFELTSPSGERRSLTVRAIETSAILGDGLDLGPITIGRAAYDGAFENSDSYLAVVSAPGASAATLERALSAHPDAKVVDKEEFIDTRMADIDMLMGIFAVLLALAVIVSLFGIVNALVLATFERRRELGMLSAIGMTRRQVRRMVRHESIVTALLGAATGVVAGLGLGWGVAQLLGEEGLTFVVPAGTLVVIAVVAVVAGVLAAILPARRASRLSPLTALAYE